MMQVFNFLNCRRLHDECNVFKGLLRSRMFLFIWLLIVVLQALIVNFAGRTFNIALWVRRAHPGTRPAGLGRLHPHRRALPALLALPQAAQGRDDIFLRQEGRPAARALA